MMRVWNRNFMGHAAHGIMPYDQRLHLLPAWAQQLEMESNGKSVTLEGAAIDHATTPVIWGTAGTGCQHSFFQALHQGTDIVPLDILLPLRPTGLHLDGDWGGKPPGAGGERAGPGRGAGRRQPERGRTASPFCRGPSVERDQLGGQHALCRRQAAGAL